MGGLFIHSRLPIHVLKTAGYARILSQGIEKSMAFDGKFDLLYEDGSHTLSLPGQDDFELDKYKCELGRDYTRITMFLCTAADFETSEGTDTSFKVSELKESKNSVIIKEPDGRM